jgi:hypothetical protein
VARGEIRGSLDSGNRFVSRGRLRIETGLWDSFQKAMKPILILLLRDRLSREMRGCMSTTTRKTTNTVNGVATETVTTTQAYPGGAVAPAVTTTTQTKAADPQ